MARPQRRGGGRWPASVVARAGGCGAGAGDIRGRHHRRRRRSDREDGPTPGMSCRPGVASARRGRGIRSPWAQGLRPSAPLVTSGRASRKTWSCAPATTTTRSSSSSSRAASASPPRRSPASSASGAAVLVMDVDLQDPPELIPEMLERWRGGRGRDGAADLTRAQTLVKRVVSASATG